MPFYAHRKAALYPLQIPAGRLQLVTCYPEDLQSITEIIQDLERKENPDRPAVVVTVLPGSLHDPRYFLRNLRGVCVAAEPVDIVAVYPLRRNLPGRDQASSIMTYRDEWGGSRRLEMEVDLCVYAEFDTNRNLMVTLTKARGDTDVALNGPAIMVPYWRKADEQ